MHPSPDTPRVHSSQIDLAIIIRQKEQEVGRRSLADYSYNGGEPSGEQDVINIYLNSGSGIDFSTRSAQISDADVGAYVAAADVNMDGHLDLIVPTIKTCLGDGSGTTFVCSDVPMDTRMSSGISAFSVGDFDGESYPSYYSTDNSVVGDHHYAKGRAAPGRLQ